MTDLEVRRIPFTFDETLPFQWNPTNPEFGLTMNILSIIAIAFERYVVAATRAAMPLIEDPAVAAEADAFLRQEAQHARAHRLHMRSLIAQYPGLQQTLDEAVASYDRLLDQKPLKFHLAYIAALEASFTPNFKMMLDHRDVLFARGDTRVVSLMEWHFVEEVEHRSSALVVYDALVPSKWYRLQVAPYALVHVFGLASQIARGFADHVPLEVTLVDPRRLDLVHQARHQIRRRLRKLGRRRPSARPSSSSPRVSYPGAYHEVPTSERRAAILGILRSQLPNHDPEHQPLPAFADVWFDAFRSGVDMTTFEGSEVAA